MASQVKLVDLPGGDKKKDGDAPKKSASSARQGPSDRDLKGRLEACLIRIAEAADARGDEVLADIIREDTPIMANGLVSLTRPIKALRTPLLLLLGITEPVMAFSRIGRVMVERVMDRRAERAARRAEAAEGIPPQ